MAKTLPIAAFVLSVFAAGTDAARAETAIPYFLSFRQECSGTSSCKLSFPTTPANRRVDLQQVSCNNATTGPDLLATVLYLNPGVLAQIRLVPRPTEQGLKSGFLYDQAVPLPVSSGRRVEIEVTAAASTSTIVLFCTLMGELVFLP